MRDFFGRHLQCWVGSNLSRLTFQFTRPTLINFLAIFRATNRTAHRQNREKKKGSFWNCSGPLRKSIATVSTVISLYFSKTSISNSILPVISASTFRTFDYCFIHLHYLHFIFQVSNQKKGELREISPRDH